MSFLSYLKEIFMRPPLIAQFEQMLVEDEARKVQEPAAAPLEPEVVAEAPVVATPEVVAEPVVEAPAVQPVAEALAVVAPIAASVTPKRTKSAKGKFVADDKSTPDVNEAFVGGKAPTKKNTKRKKR